MTTQTIERPTTAPVTRAEHTRGVRHYQPAVDILESAHELTVLADMPGVAPGDVAVNFENAALTIHGKVKPRQGEQTEYMLREYGIGDFYRTFQVSETIDAAKITAEFTNGVLTLHLPKVEAVKPRKIAVKTA
jgi:HSP20 family protein